MTIRLIEVTDPALVERYLRRDPALHIYELGDLDPLFWPRTRWWGLIGNDGGHELTALALLYDGGDLPTLIALGRDDGGAAGALVAALRDLLPAHVHAHLSPGLVHRLASRFACEPDGRHLKMVLRDHRCLNEVNTADVRPLSTSDLPALLELYRCSYPQNWFDSRMLDTQQYFGVDAEDALVCVAGVHVYAPQQGVAAIGNVATDPRFRGRGLAQRATARLCRSLLDQGVSTIGLNVHATNVAALRCYERLGFVAEAEFDVFMLRSQPPSIEL